ncbi:MAG: hypothetical protein IKY18_06065 [Oscillospiraceae bacterium]|nr:hypothetical protein [Oscillospiraceae bacterium]
MYKSKNPALTLPQELVQQIEQVTDHQIDELLLLVSRRFNALRPHREGFFLSLSLDPMERKKEIENIILNSQLSIKKRPRLGSFFLSVRILCGVGAVTYQP